MDDFMQLSRYLDNLGNVPEGLSYDEIHEALVLRTPYVARHAAVHRTFEQSGVNNLLDQLNSVLLSQCIEQLNVEANGEPIHG